MIILVSIETTIGDEAKFAICNLFLAGCINWLDYTLTVINCLFAGGV